MMSFGVSCGEYSDPGLTSGGETTRSAMAARTSTAPEPAATQTRAPAEADGTTRLPGVIAAPAALPSDQCSPLNATETFGSFATEVSWKLPKDGVMSGSPPATSWPARWRVRVQRDGAHGRGSVGRGSTGERSAS